MKNDSKTFLFEFPLFCKIMCYFMIEKIKIPLRISYSNYHIIRNNWELDALGRWQRGKNERDAR